MKTWVFIGAIFLALAVCLGAFAAHALKDKLDPYSLEVYQKANFYHFIHALGILLVAILAQTGLIPTESGLKVCLCLASGIIIFSGSLYTLAVTQMKWLGAITPIGGVLFIVAWVLLALASRSEM